jgi:DNA polymerase III epsilon subunit-like protein
MAKSMEHWNGNQLCAIDTETTGLDSHYHEIIQICILPLDSNIQPRKDIMPFYINMMPWFPERADPDALKKNKLQLADLMIKGFDKDSSIDLLGEWLEKLDLPYTASGRRKQIVPLGQNYAFDIRFMHAWIGIAMYNEYFHYHFKDTMIAAGWLNDRAAMHGEKVPYSKVNLQWLARTHNIKTERAHDALQDCVTTAKVYKEMLKIGLF